MTPTPLAPGRRTGGVAGIGLSVAAIAASRSGSPDPPVPLIEDLRGASYSSAADPHRKGAIAGGVHDRSRRSALAACGPLPYDAPMSLAAQMPRIATVEDLLAIPEEERFHEIIDGELVQKAMPTPKHGGV